MTCLEQNLFSNDLIEFFLVVHFMYKVITLFKSESPVLTRQTILSFNTFLLKGYYNSVKYSLTKDY
ncbi:hypothetical protein HanIR_Chr17g0851481 [Helianthus annuus]|nr:hypothetical protein HanIR_Chr17g0851481 [Helianthus annuus]